MNGLAGQTSFYPPESAPDPLLCWLWLAHVLGPASPHAGRVLGLYRRISVFRFQTIF